MLAIKSKKCQIKSIHLSRNEVARSKRDDWISSNLSFTYASKIEGSIEIPNTFPGFPGISLLDMTTLPLETSRGPISILRGTPYKIRILVRCLIVIQHLQANFFSFPCKKKKLGTVHLRNNQDRTTLCKPYKDKSTERNEYWGKMYTST